jgi:hypothetical protein
VRNSSLVKRGCADNVTGLKHNTETGDSRKTMVGERSVGGEGVLVKDVGAEGSANAGMSSDKHVRTMLAGRLRFPTEGQSASG